MPRFKIEEGYPIIPGIAAFLGGIFFTALIFIADKEEVFLQPFKIWSITLPISEYRLICIFLSTTSLFYMLSAMMFGLSYGQNETVISRDLYYARNLFIIGCLLTILSIYILFSIIDPLIATIQFIISAIIVYQWIMLANQ